MKHRGVTTFFRVAVATTVFTSCAATARQSTTTPTSTGDPLPGADAFEHLERVEPYVAFEQRRRTFQTHLHTHDPSQGRALPPTPPGVERVAYASGDLQLAGWLARPDAASTAPRPGVVFLHNDFALHAYAYDNARAFVDAGFILFMPTLRGENGNPGTFELLLGEVDDAAAAVAWLAEQPDVDPDHIYVIGHSIGGAIAALLSLRTDVPVQITASVGGIYRARTFVSWATHEPTRHLVPFDPDDPDEITMRLLGPNIRDMAHPHLAYAARNDHRDTTYARHLLDLAHTHDAPYDYIPVDGTHMTSIHPAVQSFIETIRAHARP